MPVYCTALGCRNTNDVKRKTAAQVELEKAVKVTFHVFPSNPGRRAQWIKIMKLENKPISKRSCLCSLHFEEKFMDRTSLVYVRLRENAIPYLSENTLCDGVEDETVLTPNDLLNIKMEVENDTKQISVTPSTYDKETNTSSFLLSQNMQKPKTCDKETRISPERIWNYSIVQTIKKTTYAKIGNLEKKIEILQQKVRRKDKKIAIMKTILDELQVGNFISDET